MFGAIRNTFTSIITGVGTFFRGASAEGSSIAKMIPYDDLEWPEGEHIREEGDPAVPNKKIVVCIDGTSNDDLDPNATNVRIVFEELKGDGYYRIYVRGFGHSVPPAQNSGFLSQIRDQVTAFGGTIPGDSVLRRLQESARTAAQTYRQAVGGGRRIAEGGSDCRYRGGIP